MTIDSFCLIFIGSTPPVIRGGETQDGQFQSQGMYATKNICILFFVKIEIFIRIVNNHQFKKSTNIQQRNLTCKP